MGLASRENAPTIAPLDARSLIGWWLDAGVDALVAEEPRDWLKPAAAPVERKAERAAPAPTLPDFADLDALTAWIATAEEVPMAQGIGRRALPFGPAEAPVMILTDAPGAEDLAEAAPLGGVNLDLAKKMLAAIGVGPDQFHAAALICVHVPGKRPDDAERALCIDLARRHVRLARPKKLLLMGDAPARALIGKPLATARGHRHDVEGVPTVATFHPRHLVNRPSDKRLAWADLLLLTET